MAKYVGRNIGPGNLLLDGRLPDGSRVNATIPPVSPNGPTMTIRKQMSDPLTVVDLMKFGTMSPRLASLLWMFTDGMGAAPSNILVAGGTGSGKTTLIKQILYPAMLQKLGEPYTKGIGRFNSLEGDFSKITQVEMVNQNPIGKSSRSNPVTYVKA